MICPNCGVENSEDEKHCSNCGAPLIKDDKSSIKKEWIVSIIAVLLYVPNIVYLIWYIQNFKKFTNSNFDITLIFVINIFILIFLMVKYKNIASIISFVLSLITLFSTQVIYVLAVSGAFALNCLGDVCTCGGIDGAHLEYLQTDYLEPFYIVVEDGN